MKNLHKKIGAMFLAGMVVAGGVGISGANSFAASGDSIQKYQSKKLQSIFKLYHYNIIKESNDKKVIDKEVALNYSDKKVQDISRNGRNDIKNPYEIPIHLQNCKNRGINFVKVKSNGIYYLIKL